MDSENLLNTSDIYETIWLLYNTRDTELPVCAIAVYTFYP